MKGSNSVMLLALMSLIVGAVVLATMSRGFIGMTNEDIQQITERHTHTIRNLLIITNTMEQDIRYYKLDENYDLKLNETHIELRYVGKTRTMADDAMNTHIFALKHQLDNIVDNDIRGKPDRICISKRIVNCVPEITICKETEPCCTIETNKCKEIN